MTQRPQIYLITGTPGSGKSSVAAALMQRFPFGLHIPMDDLRGWVVSGIAHPVPVWTDETTRQFRLARQAAAHMAKIYVDNGFAVAIDDVIFPSEADELFPARLEGHAVRKVLLQPRLEVALARNAKRSNKPFNTVLLADTVRTLHSAFAKLDFTGWTVIDNSDMTVEETVDAILTY